MSPTMVSLLKLLNYTTLVEIGSFYSSVIGGMLYVGRGIKRDEYGYISVNFTRMLYTDEPFVLASQAKQVFYVKDSNKSDWYTVIQTQPRDLYQMIREISNDPEPFLQIESYDDHLPLSGLVDEDMIVWNRNDVLGETILKNNVIPQN